jgi:hypothetical protein
LRREGVVEEFAGDERICEDAGSNGDAENLVEIGAVCVEKRQKRVSSSEDGGQAVHRFSEEDGL